MSVRDLNTNALAEHHMREADTLRAVEREAMNLERFPEGEEPRDERTIVDGVEIAPPKRLRGKLSVRW